MTLQDWEKHMTAKGITHNDAVRMLKDAEAEIEQYAALLDAYQHERNHYDATVSKLNTDNLRISKDYDRMLAGVAEIAQAAGVSGSAPNICRETVKAVKQLTEERDALQAELTRVKVEREQAGKVHLALNKAVCDIIEHRDALRAALRDLLGAIFEASDMAHIEDLLSYIEETQDNARRVLG